MAGLAYLALIALEVARQAERIESAAGQFDIAAWQVSQVLQEARDITLRAAQDGAE